jgi:hypothetical protein
MIMSLRLVLLCSVLVSSVRWSVAIRWNAFPVSCFLQLIAACVLSAFSFLVPYMVMYELCFCLFRNEIRGVPLCQKNSTICSVDGLFYFESRLYRTSP